jgi:hypothetical protein
MSDFHSSDPWQDPNDWPVYAKYHGEFSPQCLVFNANLQEFAHQVNQIVVAQGQGHLTDADALRQIEQLWQALKRSRTGLGLGSSD